MTKTTQYKFNDRGEMTEMVDPLTFTTKYEFDLGGRQTKSIDGLTKTTHYFFDDAGRQTNMVGVFIYTRTPTNRCAHDGA